MRWVWYCSSEVRVALFCMGEGNGGGDLGLSMYLPRQNNGLRNRMDNEWYRGS